MPLQSTSLIYVIEFADPVQYANAMALYPSGWVGLPPGQAAILFGANFGNGVQTRPVVYTAGPGLPAPASEVTYYNGPETFVVTGGNGVPISYNWQGSIRLVGGTAASQPSVSNSPPQGARKFIDGFELPGVGEKGIENTRECRDASRSLDGYGFNYRSLNNIRRQQNIPAAQQTPRSWERFYIRLRKLPVGGEDSIWSNQGSNLGTPAGIMTITTTGAIKIYNSTGAYPGNAIATSSQTLSLNVWYRIDIYQQWKASPALAGRLWIHLNGNRIITGVATGGGGLDASGVHQFSYLGQATGQPSPFGLEADFDDWVCANDLGAQDGPVPGLDLNTGTHIVAARGYSFGALHSGSWAGNAQQTNPLPGELIGSNDGLTSTVPSAQVQVQVDGSPSEFAAIPLIHQWGGAGIGAVTVSAWIITAVGNTTQTLGCDLDTGSGSNTVVTAPTGAWGVIQNVFNITDNTAMNALPQKLVNLNFIRGANAGSVSVGNVVASVEIVGACVGPEDSTNNQNGQFPPRLLGTHNMPYPILYQAQAPVLPLAPVKIISQAYGGTGLAQDLASGKTPIHWFFARRTDTGSGGAVFFSSMQSAHDTKNGSAVGSLVPRSKYSQAGNAVLTVGGAQTIINVAGGSYWVTAFCDPAARYLLCGNFSLTPAATGRSIVLPDSGFNPDALELFRESILADGTTKHWYKGVGHGTDTASPVDSATPVGSIATFAGAGSFTQGATVATDQCGCAFAAWRKDDGGGNTGVIDVVQYTGNGAGGTVDIAVALNGNSPVFAAVYPHSGAQPPVFRDGGNAGATSQNFADGAVANGIVAFGANKITVGTALNANLVVYDVFVMSGVAVTDILRPTAGPFTATPPAPTPAPASNQVCNNEIAQPATGV